MKRFLSAVLLLLTAASAHAQLHTWEIKDGPHVGFATGGDIRNEDFAFGWQGSCKLSDYLSVELALTRQNDEIEDRVDSELLPPTFGVDMETWAVALGGVLTANPFHRVRVYAQAGIGYYFLKSDPEDIRVQIDATRPANAGPVELMNFNVDVDNDFGLFIGAGIEITITENWEIFADYRHVSLEPDATIKIEEQRPSDIPNAPFLATTTLIPDKLEYDHGLVRVGLNYHLW